MDEILQALRWGRFFDGSRHGSFVISSVAACRYGRQMEDAFMILRAERSSAVMPPVQSEKGDFSTPLRYGRNDDRARAAFLSLGA